MVYYLIEKANGSKIRLTPKEYKEYLGSGSLPKKSVIPKINRTPKFTPKKLPKPIVKKNKPFQMSQPKPKDPKAIPPKNPFLHSGKPYGGEKPKAPKKKKPTIPKKGVKTLLKPTQRKTPPKVPPKPRKTPPVFSAISYLKSSPETAGFSRAVFEYGNQEDYNLYAESRILKEFSQEFKKYEILTKWQKHKDAIDDMGFSVTYNKDVFRGKGIKVVEREERKRGFELKPVSVTFGLSGGRYIEIKINEVKHDLAGTIESLRAGEFMRRDGRNSDEISEDDIIDLTTFSVLFKAGSFLQNKIYHNSKFFKLDPLPEDYHSKKNSCVRIVLSKIFSDKNKFLDNTGKFSNNIIDEKKLKDDIELNKFLLSEKVSFIFVDDNITPFGGEISEEESLDYMSSNTKRIFKIAVSKHTHDFSSYEYVIYVNKNHIALTKTKKLEYYIDEYGEFYIMDSEVKALTSFSMKKSEAAWKNKQKIPYVSTSGYYLSPDVVDMIKIKPKNSLIYRYIYFDFEGIIDHASKNITRAYSVSYYVIYSCKYIEDFDLKELMSTKTKFDPKNDCPSFDKLYVHFELGYDCAKNLGKVIMDPKFNDCFTYLIGFNSQSYDNFIIYNALNELDHDNLSIPFYSGSRMLNFQYKKMTRCFDVCRFTQGSLKDVCKNFKIKEGKLNVNHNIPQYYYDISPECLIKEMEKVKELEEYNNRDVEVLIELTYAISNVFKSSFTEKDLDVELEDEKEKLYDEKLLTPLDHKKRRRTLFDFVTLPGLMMQIQRSYFASKDRYKFKKPATIYNSCKEKGIPNKEKAEYYYDLFMKYKTGGRVQLFGEKPIKVEKANSPDIKSSYPNVMLTGEYYYPVGNFKEIPNNKVNDFMSETHEGIFFTLCDVDESMLKHKMLCKKGLFKNNWEHDGLHTQVFICDFQIAELEKRGAKVSNFNSCIYYPNKILCVDLFKPLITFMLKKGEQDKLKAENSPLYNSALREMSKLCLNSISGKFIESLHLNKFYELTENEYLTQELSGNISKTSIITTTANKSVMELTGSKINELQKMSFCQIGFLIYVYSKHYLYEKIEKLDPYYCDTDSLKIPHDNFVKWIKESKNEIIPHNETIEKIIPAYKTDKLVNGTLFGSWEDEYAGKETKVNYFLDKKMYLTVFKKGGHKMTFKGVGVNAKPIIKLYKNAKKSIIAFELFIDKNRLHLVDSNAMGDANSLLTEEIDYSKSDWVLMKFVLKETPVAKLNQIYAIAKPLKEMAEDVFERLYVRGKMSFLTTSLRRSIKNNKRHSNFMDGELSETFNDIILAISIKNIKLSNHEKIIKTEKAKKEVIVTDEDIAKANILDILKTGKLNLSTPDILAVCRRLVDSKNIIHDSFHVFGTPAVPIYRYDCFFVRASKTGKPTYYCYRYYPLQKYEITGFVSRAVKSVLSKETKILMDDKRLKQKSKSEIKSFADSVIVKVIAAMVNYLDFFVSQVVLKKNTSKYIKINKVNRDDIVFSVINFVQEAQAQTLLSSITKNWFYRKTLDSSIRQIVSGKLISISLATFKTKKPIEEPIAEDYEDYFDPSQVEETQEVEEFFMPEMSEEDMEKALNSLHVDGLVRISEAKNYTMISSENSFNEKGFYEPVKMDYSNASITNKELRGNMSDEEYSEFCKERNSHLYKLGIHTANMWTPYLEKNSAMFDKWEKEDEEEAALLEKEYGDYTDEMFDNDFENAMKQNIIDLTLKVKEAETKVLYLEKLYDSYSSKTNDIVKFNGAETDAEKNTKLSCRLSFLNSRIEKLISDEKIRAKLMSPNLRIDGEVDEIEDIEIEIKNSFRETMDNICEANKYIKMNSRLIKSW